MLKKALLALGVVILVALAFIVYREYPLHVSLALQGIEYQAGAVKGQVKTVTLQMNGTLHTSLSGKQSFDGTVNILGTTIPNQSNGKSLRIWKTMKYYDYGSMFTNHPFNQFTILEYQPDGSGWNGGNGLTVSAPAQNRTQALRISNDLMRNYLNDHLLK